MMEMSDNETYDFLVFDALVSSFACFLSTINIVMQNYKIIRVHLSQYFFSLNSEKSN